jgi:hypothetical protein
MTDTTHRNALQPGHELQTFLIEKVLGQGAFGITYLALDRDLHRKVAIKEYLPVELAMREVDQTIHALSGDQAEEFQWGMDRFMDEAKTLARFEHPNIVRVYSVFKANATAYMVMRFEEGESLQSILKRRDTLPEEELLAILLPLLGGLEIVHETGFIHRDIKPDNIFLRQDGSPVLIDFGSARQAISEKSVALTTIVSRGYAPYEQYIAKGSKQGPWTDIYGLAATMYRAITGKMPRDAMDRSSSVLQHGRDTFPVLAELYDEVYSERFLMAVDRGLAFRPDERPQSVREWAAILERRTSSAPTVRPLGDGGTERFDPTGGGTERIASVGDGTQRVAAGGGTERIAAGGGTERVIPAGGGTERIPTKVSQDLAPTQRAPERSIPGAEVRRIAVQDEEEGHAPPRPGGLAGKRGLLIVAGVALLAIAVGGGVALLIVRRPAASAPAVTTAAPAPAATTAAPDSTATAAIPPAPGAEEATRQRAATMERLGALAAEFALLQRSRDEVTAKLQAARAEQAGTQGQLQGTKGAEARLPLALKWYAQGEQVDRLMDMDRRLAALWEGPEGVAALVAARKQAEAAFAAGGQEDVQPRLDALAVKLAPLKATANGLAALVERDHLALAQSLAGTWSREASCQPYSQWNIQGDRLAVDWPVLGHYEERILRLEGPGQMITVGESPDEIKGDLFHYQVTGDRVLGTELELEIGEKHMALVRCGAAPATVGGAPAMAPIAPGSALAPAPR